MIIDSKLRLCATSGQTVTATSATPTTDVIDAARDIGGGDDLFMVFNVTAAGTGASCASISFQLQGSTDNRSWVDVLSTPLIVKASLVAGYQIVIPLPPALPRYIRGQFTPASAAAMAGTYQCSIVNGLQRNTAIADALAAPATYE